MYHRAPDKIYKEKIAGMKEPWRDNKKNDQQIGDQMDQGFVVRYFFEHSSNTHLWVFIIFFTTDHPVSRHKYQGNDKRDRRHQ